MPRAQKYPLRHLRVGGRVLIPVEAAERQRAYCAVLTQEKRLGWELRLEWGFTVLVVTRVK